MLPLRFPWLWWSLGWLLVAGVTFGSLFTISMNLIDLPNNDKLLHAGSYLILTVWFCGLFRKERHLVVGLLLFAMGFLLDFAQSALPYRTFELNDVAANGAGILVGLVLARYVFEGWCRRFEQLIFPS